MLEKVLKSSFRDKLTFLLILLAIIFVVATHFINLGISPNGINHDEVEVLLTTQSGLLFPQSLFFTNTEAGMAALPSLLMTPYFSLIDLNLSSSRFLFAILNISTGIVLGLIIYKLTTKRAIAIISFLVFMINPWSFAYARALTEAPFALFFLLLGILLLFSTKNKKIYYSLIPFLASFFSYQGAKVVIPILVLALVILHYKFVKKTNLLNYAIYIFIFIFIVVGYFAIVFLQPQSTLISRSPEFVFSNLNRYNNLVNESRMRLIDAPFNNFFINKYVFMLRDFASKYLGLYSPEVLFIKGDPRSTYRFGEHGLLYFIDAIFLIAGILGVYKLKNKLLGWILIILTILAPIGSAISLVEDSYIFRSVFIIPVFVILISIGIYFVYKNFPQILKFVFVGLVGAIYLILFLNFLYMFFVSFPVKQQENQYFSERVLVSYLHRSAQRNDQVIAIVNFPYQIENQYKFFYQEIAPNVSITNDCNLDSNITVVQSNSNCKLIGDYITIQDKKDAGSLYNIYNDNLCSNIALESYNRYHYFSDYDVEKLSDEEFCKRLINKY